MLSISFIVLRDRCKASVIGDIMVDFSDTRFVAFLIFDIIAISLAVWWISRKLKSKLEEVENRKKGKR